MKVLASYYRHTCAHGSQWQQDILAAVGSKVVVHGFVTLGSALLSSKPGHAIATTSVNARMRLQ